MARPRNPAIDAYIIDNVTEFSDSIASKTASEFGISKSAVARYLARLVENGILDADGNTRARTYKLKVIDSEIIVLDRDGRWNEDTVWREKIRPHLLSVNENVRDILQYCFTEMLNNVIDHSDSPGVSIEFERNAKRTRIAIANSGVGIFNKIQKDFRLDDARTALLELSKGRLTSDKRNHSGEGIYFTSRMLDRFSILSGHLFYARIRREDDGWLIESNEKSADSKGTYVGMELRTSADWTMATVFDRYRGEKLYFRRAHVPVALARYPGEQLVSRSQAKRVLARFSDFSEVMLDFSNVPSIGQPFADEIFRVFKNNHPSTLLFALHANDEVERMIKFVQDRSQEEQTLELPFDEGEKEGD